jgi:hypothetical protein
MKPEKSEPCRVHPEDEIRIGRSSWDDQDASIKYTWFNKSVSRHAVVRFPSQRCPRCRSSPFERAT